MSEIILSIRPEFTEKIVRREKIMNLENICPNKLLIKYGFTFQALFAN
jgi:hypothetical protein